jgi:hypothetical protein
MDSGCDSGPNLECESARNLESNSRPESAPDSPKARQSDISVKQKVKSGQIFIHPLFTICLVSVAYAIGSKSEANPLTIRNLSLFRMWINFAPSD